jgi:hypothetical protein
MDKDQEGDAEDKGKDKKDSELDSEDKDLEDKISLQDDTDDSNEDHDEDNNNEGKDEASGPQRPLAHATQQNLPVPSPLPSLSCPAPSAAIAAASPLLSPPPSDLAQPLTMQVTQSTGIPDSDTNTGPIAGPGPQMSHEAVASLQLHWRKANVLNLNACICGLTITKHEIEDNNRVMRC